jgi:predicted transcriptional regulator
MTEPASIGVKDAVNAVVQSLPDNVSWDEVHYRLYVRQQIEAGLADSDAGRLIDTDEMRRRLDAQRNQGSSR